MKNVSRLFLSENFYDGQLIELNYNKSHYLKNVLRLKISDHIRIFNGIDGEWLASISDLNKKSGQLKLLKLLRPQNKLYPLKLFFSPLRQNRLSQLIEKVVELGVSDLCPILMDHSQVRDFNYERASNIAIEASEQSERLSIPIVHPLQSLTQLLTNWPSDEKLYVCDERGEGKSLFHLLLESQMEVSSFIIGPEGGFSKIEFDLFSRYKFVEFIVLGNTILRSETAGIVSVALCHIARESRVKNA